jgi:hypothetical protein
VVHHRTSKESKDLLPGLDILLDTGLCHIRLK